MKTWRSNLGTGLLLPYKFMFLAVMALPALFCTAYAQQGLVFKNSLLQAGSSGTDGAVYRFPAVTNNIDALVKIGGRSSPLVSLEAIDLTSTGHDKSFQPQVTYNNGNAIGSADWWMEFQISFVVANTDNPIAVSGFEVTAIDIDGNGDKLNEYVCIYRQQSYTTESGTLLSATNVSVNVSGQQFSGKKFSGPVTNFVSIDTNATRVMTTNVFQSASSLIIRTGAKTTGSTGATDRMYSFWFKGFTYENPVQGILPLTLTQWNATYSNNTVYLKWNTAMEQNSSHFVIEKSVNGTDYYKTGSVTAAGNSDVKQTYSYRDILPAGSNGILYYRLKMTDLDGTYKVTEVKMIRVGNNVNAKLIVFPNPVTSEVRITIPAHWQDKQVTYSLLKVSGELITVFSRQQAGQTEILRLNGIPKGTFILNVRQGNETLVQTIVKAAN